MPKLADIGLVANIDATMSFVGTAGYVPPEGPGKTTGDIYSLGKLLYEISVGRDAAAFPELPTAWESFADQAGQLEFNAVVLKACAHDPEQRYQSAREMQEDLKLLQEGKSVRKKRAWAQRRVRTLKLAGACLGAVALAALGYQAFRPARMSAPQPTLARAQPSVFVLPIRSPAGYSRYDVPANDIRSRITDAFIDSLGLIEGLQVGPRKCDWVREDETELVRRVRQDFGMNHILTGRLVGTNDPWELTVTFSRAEEAKPLWTERATGTIDDLIGIEMAVVERVTETLGLALSPAKRQQIGRQLTNNIAAYRLYRRGYEIYDRATQAEYEQASKCFNQALNLDLKYLDAEVAAIEVLRSLTLYRSSEAVWTETQSRSRRALGVDETHRGARYWLAGAQMLYDWQWDEGAAALFATLTPEDHINRVFLCWTLGQTNQARLHFALYEKQAMTDPAFNTLGNRCWLSPGAYLDRRYEDGVREARKMIELFPRSSPGYVQFAYCAVELGRYEEALAAIKEGRVVEDSQDLLALLGCTYARMGRRDEALEVLRRLEKPSPATAYVQPYLIARIDAALGDSGAALTALEKACEERSEYLVTIEASGGLCMDPAWKGLREEPRFKELLKRTGRDKWPRDLPPGFIRLQ